MKRKFVFMVFLSLLVLAATAQISTKQYPRSFNLEKVKFNNENTIVLPVPNISELLSEEENMSDKFKPRPCAVFIPVNENFFDRAQKISLMNADLYILKICSEGALALNFYSDDFYIPQGCELYLWNPNKTKTLGAYTMDNNTDDGYFATDYVYDDQIIIEFYCPKNTKETAKLNIEKIGYFYRDIINFEQESLLVEKNIDEKKDLPYKDYQESGDCNVNVNCSEGDAFRLAQRSVVRMFIPINLYEGAWCTGTLINNTDNDLTPYILSAAHCIEDVTKSTYYSQIIFYFNYEYSGCSASSKEPSYSTIVGGELLAYDKNYGKGDSDYLLMKLKKSIPESINAYWSGWSTDVNWIDGCAGIHHPSGDVKKISTVDGKTQSISYDKDMWNNNTHFRVKWKQTQNGYGITEGGSSGSALFNANQQIIGTLSGGSSSCGVTNDMKIDWYGRFDVIFTRIQQWLAPHSINATECGGREFKLGLNDMAIQTFDIKVFPIPTQNNITIVINDLNNKGVLTVLDKVGRTVYAIEIDRYTNTLDIDLSFLPKGIYFVRLYSKGNSIVKKIILE